MTGERSTLALSRNLFTSALAFCTYWEEAPVRPPTLDDVTSCKVAVFVACQYVGDLKSVTTCRVWQ